jgi:hypothetical protein
MQNLNKIELGQGGIGSEVKVFIFFYSFNLNMLSERKLIFSKKITFLFRAHVWFNGGTFFFSSRNLWIFF